MNGATIGKNSVYNSIKSVSSLVFPLITYPYINRVLLADNVGKINFGASIISYFSLIASLGIATYAIRECAKVKNDKETLGKLASEIFSINVISALISYVLLIITLLFFKGLENYRQLIVIQSLVIGLNTLGTDWINNVMEDFKYITLRTLFFQLVSLVLTFTFVKTTDDYILYAIISLISSGGANLLNVFHREKYCKIRFTIHIDWKRHIKPIILLFSMQIAMVIYVNSDATILGLVRGDAEVGLYSVPVKVYNIVQSLITAVHSVLIPQLAIGYAHRDFDEINRLLRFAFNFIFILGLPCLVGIWLFADGIVILLAGESFLGSVTALRILMLALLTSLIGGFVGNLIILPSGRDRVAFISNVTSAIFNVVLNLMLIPKYGINAAAFTTFVSMFIGFIMMAPFVYKEIEFGYIKSDVVIPLIGCIGMGVCGLFIGCFIENIVIKTVVQILVCAVAYFTILLLLKNPFAMQAAKTLIYKLKKSN